MYCLFSPDLSKHLDVNPNDFTWIVREAATGEVFFKVPPTFLTYNSKKPEQIMQQTRFMCWNTRHQISMIDINADPFIEEIIEIPDRADAPEQLSYEVAAAAMPFLDVKPYLK